MNGWSDTLAIHAGVQATWEVNPLIFADAKLQISLDVTVTFVWNGSTTTTTPDTVTETFTVAPQSSAELEVVVTHTAISVPYTMTGNFVYKSGQKAPGTIHGTYSNVSDLNAQIQLAPVTP